MAAARARGGSAGSGSKTKSKPAKAPKPTKASQAAKSRAAPAVAHDPDRLIRSQAGRYRTADGRFEVQQSATGWFVVDSTQADDFGQPLMLGPFGTLEAVRGVLPQARAGKPPLRAVKSVRTDVAKRAPAPAEPAPPPPPARTWIDDLPTGEATSVRTLIRMLEREGVANPERLVRADRDGLLPAVATRLIEVRLDALVDELPANERTSARRLIRRVAEVLSAEGAGIRAPLPGWSLVETRGDGEAGRRIVLRTGK